MDRHVGSCRMTPRSGSNGFVNAACDGQPRSSIGVGNNTYIWDAENTQTRLANTSRRGAA